MKTKYSQTEAVNIPSKIIFIKLTQYLASFFLFLTKKTVGVSGLILISCFNQCSGMFSHFFLDSNSTKFEPISGANDQKT